MCSLSLSLSLPLSLSLDSKAWSLSLSLSIYLSIYLYIYIEREREILCMSHVYGWPTPFGKSSSRAASTFSWGHDRLPRRPTQKCTSKGIGKQGIVLKPRNSFQKSLCPVVICPCLCSSDLRPSSRLRNPSPRSFEAHLWGGVPMQ